MEQINTSSLRSVEQTILKIMSTSQILDDSHLQQALKPFKIPDQAKLDAIN
jgi:hypothetical protein